MISTPTWMAKRVALRIRHKFLLNALDSDDHTGFMCDNWGLPRRACGVPSDIRVPRRRSAYRRTDSVEWSEDWLGLLATGTELTVRSV
jgi:hypothetical protein